jgi:hypothetical protein
MHASVPHWGGGGSTAPPVKLVPIAISRKFNCRHILKQGLPEQNETAVVHFESNDYLERYFNQSIWF